MILLEVEGDDGKHKKLYVDYFRLQDSSTWIGQVKTVLQDVAHGKRELPCSLSPDTTTPYAF